MAHQGQLPSKDKSKIIVAALALIMITATGCNKPRPQTDDPIVPTVFVQDTDPRLQLKEGNVLLDTVPYSGYILRLYPSGDTAAIHSFYKGKEHGISREWYINKQLKEVRTYTNGRKTGIHQGWWISGNRRFEYHFSNDIYEGTAIEWYSDGKLYSEKHYANGQENGIQRIYYSNGRLQANYEAKDGRNYGNTGYRNCESPQKKYQSTAAR